MMTKQQVMKAHGLHNVDLIIEAADEAKLRLAAACALMDIESDGRNVYGNDPGGALAGYPDPVDKSNYRVYRWLVARGLFSANGVGPAQLTYIGYLADMETKGLRPWDALDNMTYGFKLIKAYHKDSESWAEAGRRYNGSTTYGTKFAALVEQWIEWLRSAE